MTMYVNAKQYDEALAYLEQAGRGPSGERGGSSGVRASGC